MLASLQCFSYSQMLRSLQWSSFNHLWLISYQQMATVKWLFNKKNVLKYTYYHEFKEHCPHMLSHQFIIDLALITPIGIDCLNMSTMTIVTTNVEMCKQDSQSIIMIVHQWYNQMATVLFLQIVWSMVINVNRFKLLYLRCRVEHARLQIAEQTIQSE